MVTPRLLFIAFLTSCQVVGGGVQVLSDEDMMAASLLCVMHKAPRDTVPLNEKRIVGEHRASSMFHVTSRLAILLYQKYVSSQQHDVCVFSPSCSRFGMASMRQCGFLKGILLTSDRLQRCSQFAAEGGYRLDTATGKYFDPVDHYCRDSEADSDADE